MFKKVSKSVLSNGVRSYSSHKEILFGNPGRQALAKGVDILANAVAATLGPKGRNVLIGNASTNWQNNPTEAQE